MSTYNETIEWVESCIGRKLTDVEKENVRIDCEISERLNVGSVKELKKCGIEIGAMSIPENEAIKLGKALYKNITSNANNIIPTKEYIEFVDMAIQALEEIQTYRAIGTVKEIKIREAQFEKLSERYLSELTLLHEYQSIGTVEEFKQLKERKKKQ